MGILLFNIFYMMQNKEIAKNEFYSFTQTEKTLIRNHFNNLVKDDNQPRFKNFKVKKVVEITNNLLWVVLEKKTLWAAGPNKGKLYNYEQKVYYIQKDSMMIKSTGYTHTENTYQGYTLTGTSSGSIGIDLDYIFNK